MAACAVCATPVVDCGPVVAVIEEGAVGAAPIAGSGACGVFVPPHIPRCLLVRDGHVKDAVDWFLGVHILDVALPSHEGEVLGQWYPIVVWP